MKILCFTTDVPPLPGLPTSGTALRTRGLIEGLRAHGVEVVVSVPKPALDAAVKMAAAPKVPALTRHALKEMRHRAFDSRNQQGLVQNERPDAILCGHWPAMCLSRRPSQALIIDLAGPHLLERHYQGTRDHTAAVLGKMRALSMADYFIVSGPSQRLYFLSFLLRAQVPQPEKRIATITMPLPPELPIRARDASKEFPQIVFGGIFLPWQDPSRPLAETAKVLEERQKGHLTLIGGKHPNYNIQQGVYAKTFEQLSESPRASVQPLLPYDEFIAGLGGYDVALDLMAWNMERQLAITIRTTSYLWAGVPVIYNDYADLGAVIQRYNAGWCISPSSKSELRDTLTSILGNPDLVAAKSINAQRLAREQFAWDNAVRPILDFLQVPERSIAAEIDIVMDLPERTRLPITGDSPVEQYFTCRMDGLSRVEFRLAAQGETPSNPITLTLFRVDHESPAHRSFEPRDQEHRVVAKTIFDASAFRSGDWCTFEFAPIPDSAGQTYLLQIAAKDDDAGRTIKPSVVAGKPYPLLGLFHRNKNIGDSSLALRTSCTRLS